LDQISSLVSKSLAMADTMGRTQARYRLLETIREYALEKLEEAGQTVRLRNRHLDLFLAQAEDAAPKLNDAHQQLWLNWLEDEHDNLRAALTWSLEGNRVEEGLRIATALVRFWEIRGHVQEGLVWFERLLAQADERVALVVHAQALAYASFLAMFLGDVSTTTAYGREAVALAEAAGEEGSGVLAIALAGLASGKRAAGDYQTALTLEERVIQLLRDSLGPPFFLGMALLAHGGVAIELGQYDTARVSLDESLAIAREAGDSFRIAHALNSLGDLARCEQKYKDAQTAYENSLALLREVGAQHDLASVLHNLGHTCLRLGDIERGQAFFHESLANHQALQNASGVAECLIGFAALALLQGSPAVGARLLGASVAIGGQRTAVASVWQVTRTEYEHYLGLARAALTETEFQAEQAAGRAMSLAQAVAYAQNLPLKPDRALASREMPDGLTQREREVAAMIGQGKTNGEIATELVLSKRTIETHVSNILSKLGLSSRGQIMLWAIDRGLT
jgi:DNA-binding CsgD family transcriptional regulator